MGMNREPLSRASNCKVARSRLSLEGGRALKIRRTFDIDESVIFKIGSGVIIRRWIGSENIEALVIP
jgi:hypothetical protein